MAKRLNEALRKLWCVRRTLHPLQYFWRTLRRVRPTHHSRHPYHYA